MSGCGKVFQFDNFSTAPTFVKDSAGQSMATGRRVRSIEVENFSWQRLYDRVYDELTYMKNGLEMGENQAIVDEALTYYKIAVERNFTKGWRTEQKLLDPSIFIHKYTARGRNKEIAEGALNIIASMNRDWMQTGRRPSGLWGAALYISALSNGKKYPR